ncbi:MAG: MerR family DNA-binding transcriptional regulator [Pseudomonadales bacterium]|nr:MerR family DNA-binding transcriptional regulator [Pseudomonadales bacterium]
MGNSTTYTISDLAKEFDITTRAIRFYEDQGLLSPARQGQRRIYHSKDHILLKLILRGKRLGFSLAESRDLIELYNPMGNNRLQLQTMIDKIAERNEQLNQQLHDIKVMKIDLNRAEQRCRLALGKLGKTNDGGYQVSNKHQ